MPFRSPIPNPSSPFHTSFRIFLVPTFQEQICPTKNTINHSCQSTNKRRILIDSNDHSIQRIVRVPPEASNLHFSRGDLDRHATRKSLGTCFETPLASLKRLMAFRVNGIARVINIHARSERGIRERGWLLFPLDLSFSLLLAYLSGRPPRMGSWVRGFRVSRAALIIGKGA